MDIYLTASRVGNKHHRDTNSIREGFSKSAKDTRLHARPQLFKVQLISNNPAEWMSSNYWM